MDVLRERGFEVLERFRRTLRGQTVGAIEEAEARAVVEVREENRGGHDSLKDATAIFLCAWQSRRFDLIAAALWSNRRSGWVASE